MDKKDIRIVYMGSPDFAVPTLDALVHLDEVIVFGILDGCSIDSTRVIVDDCDILLLVALHIGKECRKDGNKSYHKDR